jgi:hypothetical protein
VTIKVKKQNLRTIISLAILTFLIPFFACSKQTVQKSGQGAAIGAAVGAVGGMVTALVFGGNPAEAAARSAVYGASTGAAAGAISGAMAESSAKKAPSDSKPEDMEKLRKTLGEDAFSGLEALVDCKHDVAQAYGRTAGQSDNKDYALAGLWLQVIAFADNREEEKARAIFPELVVQDAKLTSLAQAETKMRESLQKLMDIREKHGRPRVCG